MVERVERLRGHAAVAQRERRLRDEPFCRDCAKQGLMTLSTVPDHIRPLAQGGTDDESNIRCLCHECHMKRTAEQFGHRYKQRARADGWPDTPENRRKL